MGDMTIPLQFASLYDGQEVFMWSDCLLDLGTDFHVGNKDRITNAKLQWPACLPGLAVNDNKCHTEASVKVTQTEVL